MSELFGVPTTSIMISLVVLLGIAVVSVGATGLFNRTMFRMGLRNLPRRGTQTGLVVVGLMLATLIVTASFVTGDTVDHSISNAAYRVLQRSDLEIMLAGDESSSDAAQRTYVSESVTGRLEQRFAGDPDIEGFLPWLWENLPVVDETTRLSEPDVLVAGIDPVRLAAFGGLRFDDGTSVDIEALGADEVLLSVRAARRLDTETGHTVTVAAGGQQHTFRVAGIVEDELASGVAGVSEPLLPPGMVMRVDTLQTITGHAGQINGLTVSLHGGVRGGIAHSPAAAARLAAFLASPEGETALGIDGRTVAVDELKADVVADAEAAGNMFTSLFMVLGLFSMAAGVLLIFMIFIMLAAERRAEMGMARAVGAQRRHLVQSFVAEGLAYSLLAGVAGVALGVAAAFGLIEGVLRTGNQDTFGFVELSITPTSLVIGYALGVVLTFVTVVFASWKASSVNIVSAIRGLDDEKSPRRRAIRWRWLAAGVPALVIPPLGIWFVFRKGLGLPWTLILAPLGLLLGALTLLSGHASGTLLPFSMGMTLVIVCVATLARFAGVPGRLTWTATGLVLGTYWLLPSSTHDALFGEMEGEAINMFFLAGVGIVTAATLVIVFNARFLTGMFTTSNGRSGHAVATVLGSLALASAAGGAALSGSAGGLGELLYLAAGFVGLGSLFALAGARFPHLAPALKMGVAFPLASRTRTGMTIAMFSLIVFSLTVFSILLANVAALYGGDEARGNLDLMVTTTPNNPVTDVERALGEAGSPLVSRVAASGGLSLPRGTQQAQQPGRGEDWAAYPVLAADAGFFTRLEPSLKARAEGYETDADVLRAVGSDPGLALVDAVVMDPAMWNEYDFGVEGVSVKNDTFEPYELRIRDEATGRERTVTVVGELRMALPSDVFAGIIVNESAYASVYGTPAFERHFLRLAPGTDAADAARSVEASLSASGVQADAIKGILDQDAAEQKTFNRMFQAFMALGLVVGIAALGVIAFRSVVERRQQIGMLRAIGFQRSTISIAFLTESSFIALMGILSGVAGGAILSRNLLAGGEFGDGVGFRIPWAEVLLTVGLSYGFALLMTWWPSRSASRVPVAEALRYE